jgi:hypothetical protein
MRVVGAATRRRLRRKQSTPPPAHPEGIDSERSVFTPLGYRAGWFLPSPFQLVGRPPRADEHRGEAAKTS